MTTSLYRFGLAGLVCFLLTGVAYSASPEGPKAIRAMLNAQVGAWNEGDLDAFMDAYWKDEEVTGISDGVAVKGWKALYERYKAAYQGKDKEMGKLAFSGVTIELLGDDAAVVRGKWELILSKGIAKGHFTQVVRKLPDGSWKITHDHSSR